MRVHLVSPGTGKVAGSDDEYAALGQLALLWHFWFGGSCEERFTVRALLGWKPHEEVEYGLPDGGHARLWWRSYDSFFSVPLL